MDENQYDNDENQYVSMSKVAMGEKAKRRVWETARKR